jgi:hypothetical protein
MQRPGTITTENVCVEDLAAPACHLCVPIHHYGVHL